MNSISAFSFLNFCFYPRNGGDRFQLSQFQFSAFLRMNIEHSTSNQEGQTMKEEKYDLEERLLEYAAAIIRLVDHIPNTRAGNHVAGQLLRSGTSALPNHGEAQAAESKKQS